MKNEESEKAVDAAGDVINKEEKKEEEEPPKVIDPYYTNPQGDDMTDFKWDGPEDPDTEIEQFLAYKTEFENDQNIKYSKNGIIQFIEKTIEEESKFNKNDP